MAGEVVTLDKQDRQAMQSGLARDGRAVDAAADHQQVEFVPLCPPRHRPAR